METTPTKARQGLLSVCVKPPHLENLLILQILVQTKTITAFARILRAPQYDILFFSFEQF